MTPEQALSWLQQEMINSDIELHVFKNWYCVLYWGKEYTGKTLLEAVNRAALDGPCEAEGAYSV